MPLYQARGVIFVGVAQEKVRVPRTPRKHLESGGTIPWIMYSTAMVNVYYFYCLDEDFGPFFLKFCSYFPYPAKLCLNGHEYLKCQLRRQNIAFEAMDNGLLSCWIFDKVCDKDFDKVSKKRGPGTDSMSSPLLPCADSSPSSPGRRPVPQSCAGGLRPSVGFPAQSAPCSSPGRWRRL